MATLRQLKDDGFEDLGTVTFGGTVVAGDPSLLVEPLGTDAWWGGAVRPGTWRLLGKAWAPDDDLLEELVLVHAELAERFYDLYDAAEHQSGLLLPTRRIAVLAGDLRTDVDTLHAAATADAEGLPWVLDSGVVAGGIAQHPAQIAASRGLGGMSADYALLSVGFTRAPFERAETVPFVQDRDED
ncbi:MAG: hypothetical protein R2707_21310 [Acidimicrobiales bacterium]